MSDKPSIIKLSNGELYWNEDEFEKVDFSKGVFLSFDEIVSTAVVEVPDRGDGITKATKTTMLDGQVHLLMRDPEFLRHKKG